MAPADVRGRVIAIKEIIDVEGEETTANSAVQLPSPWRRPSRDADVVAQLRAHGATIGPKCLTHEFAWGITTAQSDRPQAANPRLADRVAGGSSGGAGEFVADGRAWAAIGTDTGGSVRIPAAWCGVVGWKPTIGRLSTAGVVPLAPSLDHVGVLAADTAALAAVAACLGVEIPVIGTAPKARLRIARVDSDAIADRASIDACDEMLARAFDRGAVVRSTLEGPASDDIVEAYSAILASEALRVHRDLLRTWPSQRDSYGSDVRQRLEAAETVDSEREIRARLARERLRAAVWQWFADVDVVVMPTTGCPPPFRDRPDTAVVDGREWPVRDVVMPHTTLANLAGVPSVAVPVGAAGSERQRSVQLIGAPGSDALLLDLARSLTDLPGSAHTDRRLEGDVT